VAKLVKLSGGFTPRLMERLQATEDRTCRVCRRRAKIIRIFSTPRGICLINADLCY
jgi:hypothetical protein